MAQVSRGNYQIGHRKMRSGFSEEGEEEEKALHSPASFQLMEVSRGAQKLNRMIEYWSRGQANLFTNLLRSFLDSDNQDQDQGQDPDPAEAAFELRLHTQIALLNETNELFNRPWHIATAWMSPFASLMARVEQIECGMGLSSETCHVYLEKLGKSTINIW